MPNPNEVSDKLDRAKQETKEIKSSAFSIPGGTKGNRTPELGNQTVIPKEIKSAPFYVSVIPGSRNTGEEADDKFLIGDVLNAPKVGSTAFTGRTTLTPAVIDVRGIRAILTKPDIVTLNSALTADTYLLCVTVDPNTPPTEPAVPGDANFYNYATIKSSEVKTYARWERYGRYYFPLCWFDLTIDDASKKRISAIKWQDTGWLLSADSALIPHSWQVWIQTTIVAGSPVSKYAVSDRPPNSDGTWPVDAIAGSIIQPDGTNYDVPVKDWTSLGSPAGAVTLNLNISEGTISATISLNGSGTDLYASPAILIIPLAYISADYPYYALITTYQTCDINLTGSVIPAWYPNYSTGAKQLFVSDSAVVSWITAGDDFTCPA